MRIKTLAFVIALSTLAFTLPAQAHTHDSKEHIKNAEKPNCGAMKNMDHKKMDMNTPAMQDMMKQCMKDMHNNNNGGEPHNHHHKDHNDQKLEHQH